MILLSFHIWQRWSICISTVQIESDTISRPYWNL